MERASQISEEKFDPIHIGGNVGKLFLFALMRGWEVGNGGEDRGKRSLLIILFFYFCFFSSLFQSTLRGAEYITWTNAIL